MPLPKAETLAKLPLGTRVRVTEDNGDKFDGFLKRVRIFDTKRNNFEVGIEHCKKVGGTKEMRGCIDFDSDDLVNFSVIEEGVADEPVAKEDKSDRPGGAAPVYDTGGNILKKQSRSDNPHIRGLHPLQIPEIIGEQMQIAPVPEMQCLNLRDFTPKLIPIPEQETPHMTGEKFKDRSQTVYRIVREQVWEDKDTPPALKYCPKEFYFIDSVEAAAPGCKSAFAFAIETLYEQPVIGVSLQGQSLGRRGQLSLILFSTAEYVFMLDIIAIGDVILKTGSGLRDLLEDGGVMKVMHDCRFASDLLKHHYGLELANVYDTLAAHTMFSTWAVYAGYMPTYASPLSDLARAYLGIKPQFMHFPHYRIYKLDADTAIWLERPLPKQLEINAIYDVIYLLDLQALTREAMNKPFLDLTKLFLSEVRDANELEHATRMCAHQQLPVRSKMVLPKWAPDAARAGRLGVLEAPFVHQSMTQIDPMLIFSRDVVHQKKPPGPHGPTLPRY